MGVRCSDAVRSAPVVLARRPMPVGEHGAPPKRLPDDAPVRPHRHCTRPPRRAGLPAAARRHRRRREPRRRARLRPARGPQAHRPDAPRRRRPPPRARRRGRPGRRGARAAGRLRPPRGRGPRGRLPRAAHRPRPAAMSRPGPRRHPPAGPAPSGGRTTAPYLVPEVPEVAALLGAAERVLVACGRAEDAHADRAVRLAAAVDPGTLPVQALVGPGLPVPLARRIAFRALQRLAVALRPALRPETRAWTTTDGGSVVAFRVVRVDTTDLAILGQAAAQLTHPRRTREGTLGGAVESLGSRSGEPPEHRHPAALGCLLA